MRRRLWSFIVLPVLGWAVRRVMTKMSAKRHGADPVASRDRTPREGPVLLS